MSWFSNIYFCIIYGERRRRALFLLFDCWAIYWSAASDGLVLFMISVQLFLEFMISCLWSALVIFIKVMQNIPHNAEGVNSHRWQMLKLSRCRNLRAVNNVGKGHTCPAELSVYLWLLHIFALIISQSQFICRLIFQCVEIRFLSHMFKNDNIHPTFCATEIFSCKFEFYLFKISLYLWKSVTL